MARKAKTIPKYLTEDQALRLLNTPYPTKPDHRLAIWAGLHGLRASEIIHLQAKDININERLITVRHGKGAKDRQVPISPEYSNALRHYIATYDLKPNDTLFKFTRQGLYQMVRRYGNISGIEAKRGDPVTVHCLRHTFGVASIMAGIDLRSLQKALGHSSLEITAVYLDLTAADVKEQYRKHPLPY